MQSEPKSVIISIFDDNGEVRQYVCNDPIEISFIQEGLAPVGSKQTTYARTSLEVRSETGFKLPDGEPIKGNMPPDTPVTCTD